MKAAAAEGSILRSSEYVINVRFVSLQEIRKKEEVREGGIYTYICLDSGFWNFHIHKSGVE